MNDETIFAIVFWVVLFALIILPFCFERLQRLTAEGFSNMVSVGESSFWARLVPRRGDVGPEQEQKGLIRDNRYYHDYADMQRFGTTADFCRFVQQGDDPENKFLACALGGTENLSSISFRSASVKQGFVLGRDDYMRDINGDGRWDYCRVVKDVDGTFLSKCNLAMESGFESIMTPDNDPPEETTTLLDFYRGVVFWLRLRDDMVDYAQNLYVNVAGKASVEEDPPLPQTTEALQLNGLDQFVRIGDDAYLNFGDTVQLRSLRAFHIWVKFDEFTNNAHVFDFGNGAGIDNVWMGIQFRGNQGMDATNAIDARPSLCGVDGSGGKSVVPDAPSGAQPIEEMSPQMLMETTGANVEQYDCTGFAVAPNVKSRNSAKNPVNLQPAITADMIYEVWDKDQRKMRLKIPEMFTKGKWTHVVITAASTDAFRPDIAVYKNGTLVHLEPSGWLPQNDSTSKNYIGKSNWANDTSQYANRDELFKGSVFDFRGYKALLSEKTIKDSFTWGKGLLGLAS